MPNWTNEQRNAINSKTKDLLVSAAAGSGKTAVLVERIINLITEKKVDIDKLLVVTFTNAAASQMKEKIYKALIKKIEQGDVSDHIRRQLVLINRAKINTVHSFCLDVLRKNFNLIDIDPSCRIADETETLILK